MTYFLHAFRAPIDDSHAVRLACDELEGRERSVLGTVGGAGGVE